MKKYLPILRNSPFFKGLTDNEILSILHCVNATIISKERNSYIFRAGDSTEVMGLVLSVGGFNPQKNHEFVLKIFREIIKIEANAKCFFIGAGSLKEYIEKKASDVKSNIIFVGTTDDVPAYLDMFDAMILPSIFEGLPLVAVEWQINGLPCILSDTITSQCAVMDTVRFMSLNDDPKEWAKEIIRLARENVEKRSETSLEGKEKIKKAGYDILENAKFLERAYLL